LYFITLKLPGDDDEEGRRGKVFDLMKEWMGWVRVGWLKALK
jgi:hypothetical protein